MPIFNSTDYFTKFDKVILDQSKFCTILVDDNKAHPIICKKLNCYVLEKLKHYLSAKEFSSILRSASQPGKVYGRASQRGPCGPTGVCSASTWGPQRNAELHIYNKGINNE